MMFALGFAGVEEVECGEDGCQTDKPEYHACFPIMIPQGDHIFANKPCLEFVRTLSVPNENCNLGLYQFIILNWMV